MGGSAIIKNTGKSGNIHSASSDCVNSNVHALTSIDRPEKHLVAQLLDNGHRLAGQHALIEGERAFFRRANDGPVRRWCGSSVTAD